MAINNGKKTILKHEEQILAEEKQMFSEEKKILEEERKIEGKVSRNLWLSAAIAIFLIAGSAGGLIYWKLNAGTVYINKSTISAPLIGLSPTESGPLMDVYVNVGDTIPAHTVVARVGTELIKSETSGLVVDIKNDTGAQIQSGQPVVTMLDPNELRVVGELDEDKGLSDVAVGDRVTFTVDAFGGKQYEGVVDEISPTSHQNDVVFSISDQRPVNQFDVKARFDYIKYPELKNGMSAKMWVSVK